MALVTAKDIVIPAGTEIHPAPFRSLRLTDHAEILIGFDKDTTGSLTFDICEALKAGVIVDRQPFESN